MGSQAIVYLERGIALKRDGHYEEATAELLQLISEDANNCDGHYQLGLVYGFTGMFDESLEELQRASVLAPNRTDIRIDLALTYSMLGYYDEAKVEFIDVLSREPENKRALENLKFLSEPV